MILSDKTIMKMLEEGTLEISPITQQQIQPASVDVRLGDTFSVVEDSSTGIINLDEEIKYKTIQTDTYVLLPGQFVTGIVKGSLSIFILMWQKAPCLYRREMKTLELEYK